MMKQYRIGRVRQAWTNLNPPIRSSDYYENLAAAAVSAKVCAAPVIKEARNNRQSKYMEISSVRIPNICGIIAVPVQRSAYLRRKG